MGAIEVQSVLAEPSSPWPRREEKVNSVEFPTTTNAGIGDESRPGA
jgi:hypothetical protein